MKRFIFLLCTVSSLMVAQDAAGYYKLTGLDVQYYMAARYDTPIMVHDTYGAGITLPISMIQAGEIFYAVRNGPLSEAALNGINVHLNVQLNSDGTGSLEEGSFYPDQELIEGTCISEVLVLPITDELLYESNAHLGEAIGFTHPGVNVVGIPSISAYAGQTFGGLGLSQSVVFDYFPMIPEQPTLCDNSGNCFGLQYPDGTLSAPDGEPDNYPAGAPMLGVQAGFWWKEGVNGPADITSIIPGNTDPNFYLEWHAIDGAAAESGLGDIIGEDEDGDGTDFDRILGLPYITAAYIAADCFVLPGLNYPIFGGQPIVDALHDLVEGGCVATVAEQFPGACAYYGVEGAINALCLGLGADAGTCAYVAAGFAAQTDDCNVALAMATATGEGTLCYTAADIAEGQCVTEANGTANDGYVMDASLATWGNLLTLNAASFQQCVPGAMAQGMDYASAMAYCGSLYGANDSDHDFNGVDGRLVMRFDPTCVQEIEIREVAAEFVQVGGDQCGSGDVNSDAAENVLDIVGLATCVLAENCTDCEGDMNADGVYNVLDIVSLATCVLAENCGGSGRADSSTSSVFDATSAEFNVIGNEVTMTADGVVGGIQMTLSHGNDFALTLTDKAMVAEYLTDGNTTRLIIVAPEDNSLFIANGDFTIESVIATSDGETYMQTSISVPQAYNIGAAFPNPFNPTTQLTLDLNIDTNVSVKIFNTLGQLVDVIANGQMASGSYSLTWDGANAASGIYFIQTEIGSEVHSQKIMLIK